MEGKIEAGSSSLVDFNGSDYEIFDHDLPEDYHLIQADPADKDVRGSSVTNADSSSTKFTTQSVGQDTEQLEYNISSDVAEAFTAEDPNLKYVHPVEYLEPELRPINQDQSLHNSTDFVNAMQSSVHINTKIKVLIEQVEGSKDSSNQVKPRRSKTYANAASKKSRMKRKLEREGLIQRNKSLEEEQTVFRNRIANLQNEIQTLKHSRENIGRIDLKTENLLLRAEVKRHKTFVQHLNCMINRFPEYKFSEEEKAELVNDGMESIIGQVISMCYTSVCDKSWVPIEYYPKLKHMKGAKMVVRWQLLPHGSTPETATRLNIRQDTYNMSSEAIEILKNTLLSSDVFFEREYAMLCQKMSNTKQKEINMNKIEVDFGALSLDNSNVDQTNESSKLRGSILQVEQEQLEKKKSKLMRIFHITEEDKASATSSGDPLEYIVLSAEAERWLDSAGFPDVNDPIFNLNETQNDPCYQEQTCSDNMKVGKENRKEVKATVHVAALASTRLSDTLQPKPEGVERFDGSDQPCFTGMVLRNSKKGTLVWTGISSYPLVGKDLPWMARGCSVSFEDSPDSPQGQIPTALRIGTEILDSFIDNFLSPNKSK